MIEQDETRSPRADSESSPNEAAETAEEGDKVRSGGAFAEYRETLQTIVIAVLIALGIRTFAFEPFNIPSGSMIPTLLIGDYLFVSKFSYGYTNYSFPFSPPLFEGRVFGSLPERGDVAVFRKPGEEETDYIKRIVGLPGDRLQMIRGVLHINGEPVKREKLSEQAGTGPYTQYIETLPNGRQHLIQERSDREVTDNTSEYLVPEGHVFAMGDNRDNSQDSRALYDVGYVPVENLIGRAEILFFSHNGTARFWEVWRWPWAVRFSRIFNGIE